MPKARITVTLPEEFVRDIDRHERNRSRFILEAVEHELESRRRQELLASVESPHPQSEEVAEVDLSEWADWGAGEEDELLDTETGRAVHWSPGEGWTEVDE